MTKENGRLERLGQLAFILMCLAVTGAGGRYLFGHQLVATSPKRAPAIVAGTKLPSADRFNPGGAEATIVLALSTDCGFCTASLPFYDELSKLQSAESGQLQLSVASAQEPKSMSSYLKDHGVGLKTILQWSTTGLRIAATPTLILVDKAGIVIKVWEGLLDPEAKKTVVREIARLVETSRQRSQ